MVVNSPEKDVPFAWTAPARPFKRRDREFYVTLMAIVGIVCLVVFLVEGFMPVVLIVSIVFLYYVLNTVEPQNIEYKIDSRGVSVAGILTEWGTLRRYWFSRRFESDLLIVETVYFPGRMELVVNKNDKEKLNKILVNYLQQEEIPPSALDKIANFFSKKLPGSH